MIKNNKPFFSIITPLKAGDKNMIKTLNSLKSQTYKNFEHIIVISSSSRKIPNNLKKKTVKNTKIIIGRDKGIYDGINKGLKIAKGRVLGTLNSGDTYKKNGLKIVNKYFSENKLQFVFGTVKKKKKLNMDISQTRYFGLLIFTQLILLVFLLPKEHKKKLGYMT